VSESDYIVLRHGPDIPDEYRVERYEGRWYDRAVISTSRISMGPPQAIAEPAGRFEQRDDGAVAEVWEIRLATPNERRPG